MARSSEWSPKDTSDERKWKEAESYRGTEKEAEGRGVTEGEGEATQPPPRCARPSHVLSRGLAVRHRPRVRSTHGPAS